MAGVPVVQPNDKTVAVIGTGLIGRGWAIVFARAGYTVRMYDAQATACAAALTEIEHRLRDLERYGLVSEPDAILARLQLAASIAAATLDVELVQECVLETPPMKRAIFEELDREAPAGSILASSSSAIPASVFTEGLAGRGRCLVAHPANPPYLIPIVEIVPSEWTKPDVVQRATAIYRQAGQEPIVVQRELHGFILNRLQGALLNEAFRLVEDGYADAEAIDKTVAFGLGLRWSFMGPFETIDLNAPGGLTDYVERYGDLYYEMAQQQAQPRRWSADLVRRIESERRAALPRAQLGERSAWRDKRLMLLAAHKTAAARAADDTPDELT
jgi:L-gulonate 3-dehydrogenase